MGLTQTIRFDKVEELFDHIVPWRHDTELSGYIFRGHGQESYRLVPKALRPELSDWFWKLCLEKPIENQWQWETWYVLNEYNLLRDFYGLADRMGLEVPLSPRVRQNLAAEADSLDEISRILYDQIWISPDLYETAALAQHYTASQLGCSIGHTIYASPFTLLLGTQTAKTEVLRFGH